MNWRPKIPLDKGHFLNHAKATRIITEDKYAKLSMVIANI